MPLTTKGQEIIEKMKEEYGNKRGESVFYASRNKGTISGVDAVIANTPVADSVPKREK